MARAKRALDALPTDAQASEAVEALKQRILAEMGKLNGIVPGSDEWVAILERRLNSLIDAQFILSLKAELTVLLPRLVRGESGPVTKDPVDVA